ncbi:MAG TPA: ABC transporter permease [Pseudoclavibacter sp.]|nr:ABC transporter permease [Pseudoclavibacter sp.]
MWRMLREAGAGLRRNVSMVVSIILVTFISLTFVGAAVLLQMQINQMKNYWYDKAQVAIYLCTGYEEAPLCPAGEVTDEQKAAIEDLLGSDTLAPLINEYFYEDEQTAYENFQEQFEGSEVAGWVQADQLGETYWVSLKDSSDSDVITQAFADVDGVSSVTDQRAYLDQIFRVLNGASLAAVGVAALMLLCAVLLISTTIRLSAFARRKELGIMRFVGASNLYIQTPFVLEGIASALIGSLLAGAALVLVVKYLVRDYLVQQMPYVSFIDVSDALMVWPMIVAAGVLLAGFASALAIRRYLRV